MGRTKRPMNGGRCLSRQKQPSAKFGRRCRNGNRNTCWNKLSLFKEKDVRKSQINKTSRPRADDETVESIWNDCYILRCMMQMTLRILEKNEEIDERGSTFWKMLEESNFDEGSAF